MAIKQFLLFHAEQEKYGIAAEFLDDFATGIDLTKDGLTLFSGPIAGFAGFFVGIPTAGAAIVLTLAISGPIATLARITSKRAQKLSNDPPRLDIEELSPLPATDRFIAEVMEGTGGQATTDQLIGLRSFFNVAQGLNGVLATIERLQGIEIMEEERSASVPGSAWEHQLSRLRELGEATIPAIDELVPWLEGWFLPNFYTEQTLRAADRFYGLVTDDPVRLDVFRPDAARVGEALFMLRDNLTALVSRIDDLDRPRPLMESM